jgi:diguanylate cyclase (GGDEF)-like protein
MAFSMNSTLERMSKSAVLATGIVLMLILGWIDKIQGFEASFAFFYLVPVLIVGWYAGGRLGAVISILSAATWQLANYQAGETYSNPIIFYWNTVTGLSFFLAFAYLATKLKNSLEVERALSHTDGLTGALNSRAFYSVVNREILRSKRNRMPFTVCYFDADNFKYVNDHFGHDAGDDVLKSVIDQAIKSLRVTDVVARLGGDEFALLLPETDSRAAGIIVPRLAQKLLDTMQERKWPVTFSIGVVSCQTAPESVETIVKKADALMYEVKNSGKNAIKFDVIEEAPQ